MSDPRRALALNVAKRRAAKGMLPNELAEAAGLTTATTARIEGARYNPTVRTMAKLAVALDCTVADLLGGDEVSIRDVRDLQTWPAGECADLEGAA